MGAEDAGAGARMSFSDRQKMRRTSRGGGAISPATPLESTLYGGSPPSTATDVNQGPMSFSSRQKLRRAGELETSEDSRPAITHKIGSQRGHGGGLSFSERQKQRRQGLAVSPSEREAVSCIDSEYGDSWLVFSDSPHSPEAQAGTAGTTGLGVSAPSIESATSSNVQVSAQSGVGLGVKGIQVSAGGAADVVAAVLPPTAAAAPSFRIRLGPSAKRLISGAIAGGVSRTVVAPLETIRTHLMVGNTGKKSIKEVFDWIMETEGVKGLFRGNALNVLRVTPAKAIELFTYDSVKRALTPKDGSPPRIPFPVSSIAGSSAGIASCALTYPLELVKTRLTIQPKDYHGVFHAFYKIVTEEGLAELYRGLTPSIIGVIPYAGTNFFAYDTLRTLYRKASGKKTIGPLATLVIGSSAGAFAATVTFPLEVARKQMQVGAVNGRVVYKGTVDCIRCILRDQGVAGLYKGLVPSCIKLMPAAGISFMCYEALKKFLIEGNE